MKRNHLALALTITLLASLLSGCKTDSKDNVTGAEKNTEIQIVREEAGSDDIVLTTEDEPTTINFNLEESSQEQPDEQLDEESDEMSHDNSGKRIICLGDSLTEGTGGNGTTFPDTLKELSGANVINYGVFGETLSCMSARYGSNPQYLVENIVIPADCTPVKAQPSGKYGYEMLLVFGDAGIKNITIAGIEGTYSLNENGDRVFTRLTPGAETPVSEGTQIFTQAMLDKKPNDILVLWGGANDSPQTVSEIPELIKRTDEIIAYHGNDKYLVLSLTDRHAYTPVVDEYNKALSEKYGSHFLDTKTFIVNESLKHLGITPTEKDLEAIGRGDTPYSIRATMDEDENHGNADFYRIIGELVYDKLIELGYIN